VNAVTMAFLVIGGVSVAVLVLALVAGGAVHFMHVHGAGPRGLPSIAGFVGAFGFVGAIGSELAPGGLRLPVALAAGIIAALPTAFFAGKLASAAMNMHTDATPTQQDVVGTTGIVVTPVPVGGYGEVRVAMAGHQMKFNAKADQPLPVGTHIMVVEAPTASSVFVEPTTPIIPG